MKPSPEKLESLIHQTLRSLPDRRAPGSLEARVLAAIEARAARPWWQQSYTSWPIAVRCGFLLITGGLVKLALMATFWALTTFNAASHTGALAKPLTWLEQVQSAFGGISDFCGVIFHSIPPVWLYGGLAVVTTLYVALFGLGAAAYRALYAQPR